MMLLTLIRHLWQRGFLILFSSCVFLIFWPCLLTFEERLHLIEHYELLFFFSFSFSLLVGSESLPMIRSLSILMLFAKHLGHPLGR